MIKKSKIQKESAAHSIIRFHCDNCRRFLVKMVVIEDKDIPLLMLPCNNCKHLSMVRKINNNLEYNSVKLGSTREPDGAITTEEIEQQMHGCKSEVL